MDAIVIGRGVLSWPRNERVSDRYGAVLLHATFADDSPSAFLNAASPGTRGTLVAVVLETRDSPHIGDLFRRIYPKRPEVGDDITLGIGTLFYEPCDDMMAVGLQPDDGRDSDWLDPHQLYRAIHQTVELRFIPSA